MTEKIGFIGAGNMGKAIIQGLLAAKLYQAEGIVVFDAYQPTLDQLSSELGVTVVNDEQTLASQVDILIVAVKPGIVPTVLKKIKTEVANKKIVISIAAGVTNQTIEAHLEVEAKVVRVMPNTPALVGEGISSLSVNSFVLDDEKTKIKAIFSSFGKAEFVAESLIDAVVGVSGSAPAYVYIFIEALADGSVLAGLPRASAYQFAAQTVLGSAKMVLESGKHPAELKDMVCSPGGTTIAAVRSLEENKFRASVIDAVLAAATKNNELSKGEN